MCDSNTNKYKSRFIIKSQRLEQATAIATKLAFILLQTKIVSNIKTRWFNGFGLSFYVLVTKATVRGNWVRVKHLFK